MQWAYTADMLQNFYVAHQTAEQATGLHYQCMWLKHKLQQKEKLLRERPWRCVRTQENRQAPLARVATWTAANRGGVDMSLL